MPGVAAFVSLGELACRLLLLAVHAQAGRIERVDRDVAAVGGVDDRSEARLDGGRNDEALAEVETVLRPGSVPSESTSASSASIDAWPCTWSSRSL